MSQSSNSQFRGMMGGSPGEGLASAPPSDVHLGGPDPRQASAAPTSPRNVYQATGQMYAAPTQPSNVYQSTVSSPYNLQSVTDGMASMLPPSTPGSGTRPGSITQYATPPVQQQQPVVTQPPPNTYQTSPGSYAERSAMAHAASGGAPQQQPIVTSPPIASTQAPLPAVQHHRHAVDAMAAQQAHQSRILTDATRKVQEHAYYMKQAMDRDDLPTVLDRASHMVGELGDRSSSLNPKNYYELHMRALDDMPNLEEYFMGIQPVRFVYEATQYCPKVLSRLYLQICAASALIRSQEEPQVALILHDLEQAVKCVQNPVRGLFLRHYLLQAFRDKLPDGTDPSKGTVEDAYNFILGNFIEMNKLWVRLQHLPGDGKSKEQRKKRERERNELRILVGTNLVRLSQMEGVTSQVYGQIILPKILEQIVVCGDPLAQAYLMDCIIQVFPDEYHIQTLAILLRVCPKLRDKVNIRTILQSLMDRLANYYAEEELLDEMDTNQVKKSLAMDSFGMFEECVKNVYNARGPKLTSKEVIRLQTALLNFSLKCYPGQMEQVNRCLEVCVASLHQASNAIPPEGTVVDIPSTPKLDEASIKELEKLLSIPLDTLALKVLELDHYADLLAWLPWANRRDVGMTMLRAIVSSGKTPPQSIKELEELFSIISPVFREEHAVPRMEHTALAVDLMKGLGVSTETESFGPAEDEGAPVEPERAREMQEENNLVSKLVHMLFHQDTDVEFEMLCVARKHLCMGGKSRAGYLLAPIVFSALRLADRIYTEAHPEEKTMNEPAVEPAVEETKEEPQETGDEPKATEGEPKVKDEVDTEPADDDKEPKATDEADKEPAGDDKGDTAASDQERDDTKEGAPPQVETVTEDTENVTESEQPSETTQSTESEEKVPESEKVQEPIKEKSVSCRKVYVFLQKTIAMLAKSNVEMGIKLYLQTALAADNMAALGNKEEFGPIVYELISQGFVLYEDEIGDSKAQSRNIKHLIGTLLACGTLSKEEYEGLIPKAAQYSAKLLKKSDQCQMVALCAHLFYTTSNEGHGYQNPHRALECLQRSLKLADASTTASSSYVYLFVDLFEHYLFFFEKGNPLITDNYVSGLAALIKEHLMTVSPTPGSDMAAINDAKAHYDEILRNIQNRKECPETAERFSLIQCDPNFLS